MDDQRFRRGKTRSERASGEAARRANNRDLRSAYTRECKSKATVSPSSFPLHTCNGQKSRPLKAK